MNKSKTRVIFLCVDGSSLSGDIRKALKDACARCGVFIAGGNCKYSGSAMAGMSAYRRKLRDLVSKNGGDPASLSLLIVGKSLGAAKMYKFFYKYADCLKSFHKVALILVDAHEPIAPGDEGDTGGWYDYVYFSNNHHLKWWADKWGPAGNQSDAGAAMRLYVIYQRNDWPRGYGMREAYRWDDLTGKVVLSYSDNKREQADHWNIAWCDKTVDLMADAVDFLNNAAKMPCTCSTIFSKEQNHERASQLFFSPEGE